MRAISGDQPEPEPMSEKQRLEQMLYRLADDIADDGEDQIRLPWSREVRTCAGQIRAGWPSGLRKFLGLFSGDPRNTISDQRFARTRTFREAYRLASKLLDEHDREQSRLRAAERGDNSSVE